MTPDLSPIFREIENIYSELQNSSDKESFILNLKSLAHWNKEPSDYVEHQKIIFPASLFIAHSVCHPECGVEEFIVEGGTQKCQRCGGLLFRTKTLEYKKI